MRETLAVVACVLLIGCGWSPPNTCSELLELHGLVGRTWSPEDAEAWVGATYADSVVEVRVSSDADGVPEYHVKWRVGSGHYTIVLVQEEVESIWLTAGDIRLRDLIGCFGEPSHYDADYITVHGPYMFSFDCYYEDLGIEAGGALFDHLWERRNPTVRPSFPIGHFRMSRAAPIEEFMSQMHSTSSDRVGLPDWGYHEWPGSVQELQVDAGRVGVE